MPYTSSNPNPARGRFAPSIRKPLSVQQKRAEVVFGFSTRRFAVCGGSRFQRAKAQAAKCKVDRSSAAEELLGQLLPPPLLALGAFA